MHSPFFHLSQVQMDIGKGPLKGRPLMLVDMVPLLKAVLRTQGQLSLVVSMVHAKPLRALSCFLKWLHSWKHFALRRYKCSRGSLVFPNMVPQLEVLLRRARALSSFLIWFHSSAGTEACHGTWGVPTSSYIPHSRTLAVHRI